MVMAKHFCAQCRDGEKRVEADWYVQGKVEGRRAQEFRGYHGYLCDDHLRILAEDGAIFPTCVPLDRSCRCSFKAGDQVTRRGGDPEATMIGKVVRVVAKRSEGLQNVTVEWPGGSTRMHDASQVRLASEHPAVVHAREVIGSGREDEVEQLGDALVEGLTGFTSFRDMLKNVPTLMGDARLTALAELYDHAQAVRGNSARAVRG